MSEKENNHSELNDELLTNVNGGRERLTLTQSKEVLSQLEDEIIKNVQVELS